MKVPTEKLIQAAIKKRGREGPSRGQQAPAPKRPTVSEPEPPVPQEPPSGPEIDLTADTPPERAVPEEVAPTEPVAEEPTTAEEPGASNELVPDEPVRDWGEGPSGAASPPPEPTPMSSPPHAQSGTPEAPGGDGVDQRLPRDSVLHDGRRAERLIASILLPEVKEELSHLKAATFFRESYAALVRIANSLAATREVIHNGKGLMREAQKEAEEARARAERAEESLELARTARADEIKAAEDRAEEEARRAQAAESRAEEEAMRAQAAENRAEVEARWSRMALGQMMEAENAVAARNLHITELESVLREAETRAREAEEKANKTEEELSRALSSLATEKESRAAEVEATVEARTAQCVENFRASEQFLNEMAEASAEAFLQGFQHGKEKVAQDLNFPQALEVELEPLPKAAPSDEGPAPGEP